ncbi:ufm1-specific protease 1 [Venturia canescens]|uniref:ufm1-specific protease 1 n=1 Tax=Venturia canescens TaxID=32260 RepID=UPI001C9BDB71|nr:ufm1-specific protease 1 [Venturia canescens]XP_043285216.1 ufm1-specific protease 1 [Venturia canescens]XP_043285217.1 ufm1-specific protease 1 [Venturia canescens]XP_043285218.1 ufm1-specific protease 1 [Venturia canescens]XP_043285219.1 ufm1-specific protease 1 [Venturia canescens]
MSGNEDYSMRLLRNVHVGLPSPEPGETVLVRGDYEYWHYNCDGFKDQGWGCGYRTLQTISSWLKFNKKNSSDVPSLREIQKILVDIEDKESSFAGSRMWIGSFEVCLVLDERYEVQSKIIHVSSGKDLSSHVPSLKLHFEKFGSPVMMGGDKDCSSKGLVGIHVGDENTYLLVVDPHFVGRAKSREQLQQNNWTKWQNLKDFIDSSFYNICLPQIKSCSA